MHTLGVIIAPAVPSKGEMGQLDDSCWGPMENPLFLQVLDLFFLWSFLGPCSGDAVIS